MTEPADNSLTTPIINTVNDTLIQSVMAAATTFTETPVSEIPAIVQRLRNGFNNRSRRDIEARVARLYKLAQLIDDNEAALLAALKADLKKSRFEGCVSELDFVRNEIYEAIDHCAEWSAPTSVKLSGVQRVENAWTVADPLGVAAVLVPFNYPLQLLLGPLASAICAGCTVLVKPSELTPACSDVIARLIPKYFQPDDVAVVTGGIPQTTALLAEEFGSIFFTGSERVGKIVAAAAAKFLTPVVLELGGKSPTFVSKTADIRLAGRRIAWGKTLNSGQTCIAPDYVLVHPSVKQQLIAEIKAALIEFWGENPENSADYGRIVSEAHVRRLAGLSQSSGGKTVVGGEVDVSQRYVSQQSSTALHSARRSCKKRSSGQSCP